MSGEPLSRDEQELLELLRQQDARRHKWELLEPPPDPEALERLEESERHTLLARQLSAAKLHQKRAWRA